MAIHFGTDGWRGVIGEDYTFDNVRRCTQGFATFLLNQGKAGEWVVVGYGYTKRDRIMRAVIWKPDAQGNYGAPIRLAALGGRSSAWAHADGINSKGQVVGTSAGSGANGSARQVTGSFGSHAHPPPLGFCT